MVRTFTLEYKDGNTWEESAKSVTAVFPFTTGDLLDERLDEAKVVFFNRVKAYKPLTEFRATFLKNGQPDNDADSNSVEYN